MNTQGGKPEFADEIAKIRQFAIDTARPTEHHGLKHWENTERFGMILAKRTGANLTVVRAFAYLHDIGKQDDWVSKGHGKQGAEIVRNNSHLIGFLNPIEKAQLLFAIEGHDHVKTSIDITVNTCWDADRLDLNRIGIKPIPYFMASEAGYYFAANPDKIQTAIDSLCL